MYYCYTYYIIYIIFILHNICKCIRTHLHARPKGRRMLSLQARRSTTQLARSVRVRSRRMVLCVPHVPSLGDVQFPKRLIHDQKKATIAGTGGPLVGHWWATGGLLAEVDIIIDIYIYMYGYMYIYIYIYICII